ncbi:Protein kinase, putative [Hondaea fermentalgiana]|uniref:Protein kinase, putative n=1 Tax=Hondaea fermentalgiana TaxID=2315210 RepID=A0A2R5GSV3_9STRA|nr:Protein kinase, putative [Hondaea fermentalgiana]|eukprot:GBG33956.1 Protein kinase, putative [Hondaea fermentalgiana]
MGCAQSKRDSRAAVDESADFEQLERLDADAEAAAQSSAGKNKARTRSKSKASAERLDEASSEALCADEAGGEASASDLETPGLPAGADPSAKAAKGRRRSASQSPNNAAPRISKQNSSAGSAGSGSHSAANSGPTSSSSSATTTTTTTATPTTATPVTATTATASTSSASKTSPASAETHSGNGDTAGAEAANTVEAAAPAGRMGRRGASSAGEAAKGANISRRGSADTGNGGNLRAHPSSSSSGSSNKNNNNSNSSNSNNNSSGNSRSNNGTGAADNDEFYGLDINYNDIELRESIGSGTYGQVFKCRYKGKQLALKKIFVPEGAMERAEMLEDFAKELGILSVLRHERIVQFKGAVRKHPTYALMFELCEGCVGTLLRMVRRRKVSVTWSICITIAKDCAEAVSYLHSLRPRILHRDLKSENLLLTSRFRCKLTDFGLSRVYEGRRRTMTVCGTPCWVAPEIFRGEAYNEKIDVYSFGVVLWELFTGRKPYTEYESVELPYRVGKKGLRPPLLKHVPPSINRLMRDCWHESPGMRPTFPEIEKRLAMIESELNDASCLNTPAHQTKVSWNQQVAHARQPGDAAAVPGTRRSHTSTVA